MSNYFLPAVSFMCQYKDSYRIYNQIIVSSVAVIASASAIKQNHAKCLEEFPNNPFLFGNLQTAFMRNKSEHSVLGRKIVYRLSYRS